jgi:2,3-diketo-5-methylthio-1-phosphopentane phosphatase/HAD superfamily hydrolase (TIGR01509 family)
MKQLVLCDFDGTITTRDVGYALFQRFSSEDWEVVDREFRKGAVGSKDAYSRIAGLLSGDEKTILDFVKSHTIDPSFVAFYRFCQSQGIDLKIVSDGLDFYIKALLEAHGLSDVSFYANQARFVSGNRIAISFPFATEECGRCGTCKKRLVQIHRETYDFVFFVGNGLSDRCAAKEADLVFAKEDLYPYCVEQELPCLTYETFGDIRKDLEKRVQGVIFDLDGTLIEAYEAIYLGLQEALRQLGKAPFPYEALRHHLMGDLESTLAPFFAPDEMERAIPIMRKKYEEVYLEKSRFINGAREVLGALSSRKIALAVASNKLGRFARGTLTHLGALHYFKSVTGAGDVPRNKPFPDMIQAALEKMNLSPQDAVFVGDTLTDIETGKQAGVDVYALATGFHSGLELSAGKPKRILQNLGQLPRAVIPLSSLRRPVS